MTRRRTWEPARNAPPAVLVPLELHAEPAAAAWQPWPGPIAVARPPCSTPSCRRTAMHWARCRCGTPLASCADCAGLTAARAAHRCA